jgi:hypothetical protein
LPWPGWTVGLHDSSPQPVGLGGSVTLERSPGLSVPASQACRKLQGGDRGHSSEPSTGLQDPGDTGFAEGHGQGELGAAQGSSRLFLPRKEGCGSRRAVLGLGVRVGSALSGGAVLCVCSVGTRALPPAQGDGCGRTDGHTESRPSYTVRRVPWNQLHPNQGAASLALVPLGSEVTASDARGKEAQRGQGTSPKPHSKLGTSLGRGPLGTPAGKADPPSGSPYLVGTLGFFWGAEDRPPVSHLRTRHSYSHSGVPVTVLEVQAASRLCREGGKGTAGFWGPRPSGCFRLRDTCSFSLLPVT